ncbi:MAG: ribosome silencing factor [Polyangiaceae bacterium]
MATKKTDNSGSKSPKKTTTLQRSAEKGALAPGGGRPRLRSSHGGQAKSVRGTSELAPPKRVAAKKTGKLAADSPSIATDEARELATLIAVAALDKKAVGLEILDVAGKVDYADFLVLMTGRSDRQVSALTQGIEEALQKKNKRPISVEGMPHANWVLMDYGDVVVHVFQDEARGLYDLEGLWTDARRLPVPLPEGPR